MNLFELQERLKDFSQDQLVNEMQAPTGTAPQYLVLSELQRRQRMMMEEQAQMPQDQTTVAQDAVAAAGVPQDGLSGMAQAMAPRTDMDMNTGVAPVERMQQGGLAGISRDLGAYSPTMGGARAIMPTPETDALRRYLSAYRAAIAGQNIGRKSASRPLETDPLDPRSGREPSLEELSAALGVMDAPDFGMATLSDGQDPRFYPVEGRLASEEEREPVSDSTYTDALRDYLTTYRGERDVSRPLEVDPLDPRSMARDIVEPAAEPLPSGYTLSRLMFPFRDPEAERLRLLGEEANLVMPPAVAVDEFTGLGSDMVLEGSQDVGLPNDLTAIIPLTPDDDTTRPTPRPDRETSTPPRGPSGTGVIGGAPAVDDAFEQDKWLALAQAGLALMSSQQPTFGGALGEAGLTGISALRTARGERDARASAAQARADRMAAAAAAAAEERPASYEDKAVRDLLTQRERLFQEASSYVDDLGMIAPGYEGRYERLIKNIDAIDTMVSAATMSRFPGLMESLTEE